MWVDGETNIRVYIVYGQKQLEQQRKKTQNQANLVNLDQKMRCHIQKYVDAVDIKAPSEERGTEEEF